MNDKLVKIGSTIETAEAFAEKIGRAIADNDVVAAQALSGELREKLEACGAQSDGWKDVSTGEYLRCTLPKGHQSEHRCDDGFPALAWDNPEWSQANKLANTTNVKPDVRRRFVEGKHFARLNAVYFDRNKRGQMYLVFQMNIIKSRLMSDGEILHAISLDSLSTARRNLRIVAAQLNRLDIDLAFISNGGGVINEMDVVVVAVEKLARNGRKILSVNLRRPDDTDTESDFE